MKARFAPLALAAVVSLAQAPAPRVESTAGFSPIAAMIPGFVAKAGLDVELSAFMTSVSLVVGIIVMPTLYLALS